MISEEICGRFGRIYDANAAYRLSRATDDESVSFTVWRFHASENDKQRCDQIFMIWKRCARFDVKDSSSELST